MFNGEFVCRSCGCCGNILQLPDTRILPPQTPEDKSYFLVAECPSCGALITVPIYMTNKCNADVIEAENLLESLDEKLDITSEYINPKKRIAVYSVIENGYRMILVGSMTTNFAYEFSEPICRVLALANYGYIDLPERFECYEDTGRS